MAADRTRPVAAPGVPAWRAALSLALLAGLAGAIVGLAWEFTREPIAANRARQVLQELSAVLPPDLYDNEPHRDLILRDTGGGEPVPVYRARRKGQPAAAVLTSVAPDGYAGPIRLLVGIAADGRVLGVRVVSHRETPGVGDAIDGRRSGWVDTFRGRVTPGLSPGAWQLRRDGGDFDQITGATISSRAVVLAVGRAVQYFMANRDEIFAAPAVSAPAGRNRKADGSR